MKTNWKLVLVGFAALLVSSVVILLQAYMLFAMVLFLTISGCILILIAIGRGKGPAVVGPIVMTSYRLSPSNVELQAAATAGISMYRGKNSYLYVAHPPNQK